MSEFIKRFNLLRWFALQSLVSILLIGVATAYLIATFLTSNLLARDAHVSQEFIQSIADGELAKVEQQVDSAGPPAKMVNAILERVLIMPDVIRANIFAPDRRVIASTNKELVNNHFLDNDELEEAIQGKLVIELLSQEEDHKSEHGALLDQYPDIVENYLPIWDSRRKQILAVAELYRSPNLLFETIAEARWAVWGGTFASALFLYVTLFWIVLRANRTINTQQQQLVERETLALVGEMASAIAHSIRNPLAAIRSSAELMGETLANPTDKESANDIVVEADRLERSIREMLVLSRSGNANRFRTTQLADVYHASARGFSQALKRQNVTLAITEGQEVPAIYGDETLLGQMFNSLIANALEAMPNGGKLTIEETRGPAGKEVQINISDTGIGMNEERMQRLFKPLATGKSRGLGLGMTLVKQIVERHNGTITVDSAPGSGTTVYLRFPAEA